MADEEYGRYGRTGSHFDEDEDSHRSSGGRSARRTMDEPDPEVPTAGYSLESTYGRADDDVEESGRRKTAYNRPRPSGHGTMDEPDPERPTEGYSLENTYGSAKLDDDAENEDGSAYGRKQSETRRAQTSSYKPSGGRTADEPDPEVPTEGYSIDSVYGSGRRKNDDDDEVDAENEEGSAYGRKPTGSAGYNRPQKSSFNPTGAGTADEPDPEVPTEGYSIDSVYGSGRRKNNGSDEGKEVEYGSSRYGKKTEDEDEESTGYGGRRPSGGAEYNRPQKSSFKPTGAGTADEPDPEVPTEGYSIDSVYGSGRRKNNESDEGKEVEYGSSRYGKRTEDEDEESTGFGCRRPSGGAEYNRPQKSSFKQTGAGTADEPDPEVPTEGYSIDSVYGSSRRKTEDGDEAEYGGSKYGQKAEGEDSESTGYGGRKPSGTAGYHRPQTGSHKPTGAGTADEPDPEVPTEGYSIDSVYGSGRRKNDDDDEASAEYGGNKYGKKTEKEDSETTGYGGGRPGYGVRKNEDDEDKISSYKKPGHRYGEEEEGEARRPSYGQDEDGGGRSKYGQSRYGSHNDDEELLSSTGALSLDSEGYSRRESGNRRGGDDDDDHRRGRHGHRRQGDDDEE